MYNFGLPECNRVIKGEWDNFKEKQILKGSNTAIFIPDSLLTRIELSEEKICSSRRKSFLSEQKPFQKGFDVRRYKQEATKIIPVYMNGENKNSMEWGSLPVCTWSQQKS